MKKLTSLLEQKRIAPILIMIAAALWALDALVRTELTFTIPSSAIVFYEHVFGFVLMSPIFYRALSEYKLLNKQQWIVAVFVAALSSVGGTILFTEALNRSFEVFDFATPILLQKLQPLFVILLSYLFLKEKLTWRFILLVPIALIGSYMISFGTSAIDLQFSGKEAVYFLAVGAAAAWGTGTVLSKKLLGALDFSKATALRFALAIPISFIVMLQTNGTYSPLELGTDQIIRFLIIALTTGGGAMLIYYKGLQNTQAKISTFAELTFPIVSILIAITSLNPYGEAQKLLLANIFGITLLLISIMMISLENDEKAYSDNKK